MQDWFRFCRLEAQRWFSVFGSVSYQAPFDRHDWVVDRCGTRVRYVIDFYSGRADGPAGNLAFYLDTRPALDNWEGVKMRLEGFAERWFGPLPWLTEKKPSST